MAVDWSSYRLAPDFSGLAAGIQGYFKNRQAAEIAAANQAMEQQKMGMEQAYRDRMLALEEQKAMRGVGSFAPGVSLSQNLYQGNDGNFYRPQVWQDRNTGQTVVEYISETSGDVIDAQTASNLNLRPTTIDIATAPGKAGAARKIAEETEKGKGAGKAATVAGVTEQEQLGKERAKVASSIRGSYDATKKIEPVLYELENALRLASQGKLAQAGTVIGKYVPGVDVSNEENLNSAILQYSTDRLLTIPGIATDADFNNQLRSFINQGNSTAANKLIIERVKRQNEYNKYVFQSYNRAKNEQGKQFDPLTWEQPSYEGFLAEQQNPKGKGAPAQQPVQQGSINVGKYKVQVVE